ncbi:MAG: hypothetical protein AAF160_10575 [Pseudomonadota bacterium]
MPTPDPTLRDAELPASPRAGPSRSGLDRAVTVALLTVMGSELLYLATGLGLANWAADIAVIAVACLTFPRFGLREVYLLTFCATLVGLALWLAEDPSAVLRSAFDQAAFLMAFILLIGLIQQAAATSRAIRDCGLYLTKQPSGRRYFSIFLGTHFMAQLFNLGTVSLLTPLIRGGSEANAGDALQPIRERRQLTAMLRGFAWAVVWSPTAVAPVVLATLLPDAERLPWIAVAFAIAMGIVLIGWAEDRWTWAAVRRRLAANAPAAAPPFPQAAYAQFAGVALALLGLTLSAMAIFGGSVVFGLMMASPIIMLGWLGLQVDGSPTTRARAAAGRAAAILRAYLPGAAPLAVTLACSGFIGRAAAGIIPSAEWAEFIGLGLMPGWLFLLALSVSVAVLSQLALSPIMMAVFIGSLIAELPTIPADVTWAALAISCGWALSMTTSPFATVVLMIEQSTGHRGRAMTWFWNWRFSLLSTLFLAAVYWVLTGGA